MRGTKHRSRMDDLANLHQQKSSQLFVRLKAEEHLRNIEKRGGDLYVYFHLALYVISFKMIVL